MSVYSGQAWLYFIRPVGLDGPIKIGVTLNPDQRLTYHRKHSPLPLEYAGRVLMDGAAAHERGLHRRFSHLRLHHDWFAASEELEAVIADLTTPDTDDHRHQHGGLRSFRARREGQEQNCEAA